MRPSGWRGWGLGLTGFSCLLCVAVVGGFELGEACIDLSGAWQAETRFEISCGVGSCDLHRPDEAEAIVALVGSDAAVESVDRPLIEVHRIGVFDNVRISASLASLDETASTDASPAR